MPVATVLNLIPDDVWLEIFEHSENLRASALVCRAWNVLSYRSRFHTVRLAPFRRERDGSSRNWEMIKPLSEFLSLLDSSERMSACIRQVVFEDYSARFEECFLHVTSKASNLEAVEIIRCDLSLEFTQISQRSLETDRPCIKRIRLDASQLPSILHLAYFLSHLRQLQSLSIGRLSFHESLYSAKPSSMIATAHPFTQLANLTLSLGSPMAEIRLLDWLMLRPAGLNLRSLRCRDYTHSDHALKWTTFIQSNCRGLSQLTLSSNERAGSVHALDFLRTCVAQRINHCPVLSCASVRLVSIANRYKGLWDEADFFETLLSAVMDITVTLPVLTLQLDALNDLPQFQQVAWSARLVPFAHLKNIKVFVIEGLVRGGTGYWFTIHDSQAEGSCRVRVEVHSV